MDLYTLFHPRLPTLVLLLLILLAANAEEFDNRRKGEGEVTDGEIRYKEAVRAEVRLDDERSDS